MVATNSVDSLIELIFTVAHTAVTPSSDSLKTHENSMHPLYNSLRNHPRDVRKVPSQS